MSVYSKFSSRRSTVSSTKGIVALSQPLANAVGIKVLELGGNCVDAAVAVLAALCVLEPMSTGIGGDCFALVYKNETQKVLGLNGSGRCAAELTLEHIKNTLGDINRLPILSPFCVTVPGAIKGWYDAFEKWGSGNVEWAQLLLYAIEFAENGFPVLAVCADMWQRAVAKLEKQNPLLKKNPFLIYEANGVARSPNEGEIMKNPEFANTLKIIAEKGVDGFYSGSIANAIVDHLSLHKHKLSLVDLSSHSSTVVEPIKVDFMGKYNVWEIPPSGQGLVALMSLGIIEELHNNGTVDLYTLEHNSARFFHLLIEVFKIAFYESNNYVTDLDHVDFDVDHVLKPEFFKEKAQLFQWEKLLDPEEMTGRKETVTVPDPRLKSDTVYFTVTDSKGDACSFINSVYESFGSAIVVPGYGFALQNRGASFNLTPGLVNCLAGGKRPYHTIIPGMITNSENNTLYAAFGNMGGYMQPLGHVLHVLNMTIYKFNPQESIDSPRFCLEADTGPLSVDTGLGSDSPVSTIKTIVSLEEGIASDVVDQLKEWGHTVRVLKGYDRQTFGRAQIIKNISQNGQLAYNAGSDPRGDGAAVPLI